MLPCIHFWSGLCNALAWRTECIQLQQLNVMHNQKACLCSRPQTVLGPAAGRSWGECAAPSAQQQSTQRTGAACWACSHSPCCMHTCTRASLAPTRSSCSRLWVCTGRCAHWCLLCCCTPLHGAGEPLSAVSSGLLSLLLEASPSMLWRCMCRCDEQLLGCCTYCPGSLEIGVLGILLCTSWWTL